MRRNKLKSFAAVAMAMSMMFAFGACAAKDDTQNTTQAVTQTETKVETTEAQTKTEETTKESEETTSEATTEESYDGKLVFDHSMELSYAKNFSVDYYKGGYKLITIAKNKNKLLVVPENMSVPENLDADVTVLQMPIKDLLISSTPAVSLINAMGALDRVTMTTNALNTWYIDEVKDAFANGTMEYIGSYDAPDYETIVAKGASLAIYSSMITEDVEAQFESLGIKCITDQSSAEDHPLARVEWVKLFGAMFDMEKEATDVFSAQETYVSEIANREPTGKNAVIFYISSKGEYCVRNTDDYMAKMIALAGGHYTFDGKVGVGKTGTTKMDAESFYADAKDADIIIYVWSMGGKPSNMQEFIDRSPILADLKAVKEGNVWCTTPDYFQISCSIGNMINDINLVFNTENEEKFTYLYKLK